MAEFADLMLLTFTGIPPNYIATLRTIAGGDAECYTGNIITGGKGQCSWFGQLFHFLCDILCPHPVYSSLLVNLVNKQNKSTGLEYKAFTWFRDFLPMFPKITLRQSVGGCGAAKGNSKPCKPFSPTQYSQKASTSAYLS